MKAILFKLIKNYILKLLLKEVVEKLRKEVSRTTNNIDDQAVDIVEKYIRDSLK